MPPKLTSTGVADRLQEISAYTARIGTLCNRTNVHARATFYGQLTVPSEYLEQCTLEKNIAHAAPPEFTLLCGLPKHFSGMKMLIKTTSGSRTTFLLSKNLWYLNNKERSWAQVNRRGWTEFREFINAKYLPAISDISNLFTEISRDAFDLSLDAFPGTDITRDDNGEVQKTLLQGDNKVPLTYPLRACVGDGWKYNADTQSDDIIIEYFYLPAGQETLVNLRDGDAPTSISGVHVDQIRSRGAFWKYIVAAGLSRLSVESKEVVFFEANMGLEASASVPISANNCTDEDVIVNVSLLYTEHVTSAHGSLMGQMRARKEALGSGDYAAQMKIFAEIVQSLRNAGGRFLRKEEGDGSTSISYREVGDVLAAYIYLPLVCEQLLEVPIKPGSGANNMDQPQVETQAASASEACATQAISASETKIRMAAVGLSLFRPGNVKTNEEDVTKAMRDLYSGDGGVMYRSQR